MSADESITSLPEAVAALGALPMPAGPALSELERLRLRVDEVERAYTFDTAELKRRIAELEAERHSTNEALDDAVQQRRADQEAFEAVRALCDAADYAGIVSGGWFTVGAIRKALRLAAPGPDAVTKAFSPVASLREPDGEHYPHVHHDYRKGRDLELAQTGVQSPDRIVAYRAPISNHLFCALCGKSDRSTALASEDLPEGGLCVGCGTDVLIDPKSGGA